MKAPLTYTIFRVMFAFTWYTIYLPVKSCITITTPASFLQFLTFFYAHKTCQEYITRWSQSELPLSFPSELSSDFYNVRIHEQAAFPSKL